MGSITRTALVLVSSAALAGGMAVPASAAEADTEATVTVTGGGLTMSAPPGADFGQIVPGGPPVTANLVGVAVADGRAGTTDWTASVSLTDFVGDTSPNAISATNATYDPSEVTSTTGTVSVETADIVLDLSAGGNVQSATAVSGNNTAAWNAVLAVTAPLNTLVDEYTATLTHSVL